MGQMSGMEHGFGVRLAQALIWGVIVMASIIDICIALIKLLDEK